MKGYRRKGAVKNESEEDMLHMFFSPFRVPKRMTNDEVKVCLLLAGIKQKRDSSKVRSREPIIHTPPLPSPLLLQHMTRRSFRRGVWEFLKTRT